MSTGRRIAGRYELIEPIGAGGMATVWRARDMRLGRHVAVKLLRAEYSGDAGFVARFEAEARMAASLAHPNIAPIHDTGVDDGDRYIVMEHVEGTSLAQLLDERGRVPADQAVAIAAAAARGLGAAHRRGLVHRDVKPANILIGRDGRVRVVDFGIARALTSAHVTETGMILGSIPYLSPEQALGEEPTAETDVYALGVVLFELLTGGTPWHAPNPAAIVYARVNQLPPSPSEFAPDVPDGLDAIVLRAMARDPEDRYPNGRSFADALEAWRRGHPAEAGATAVDPSAQGQEPPVHGAPDQPLPDQGTVVRATARPNIDARRDESPIPTARLLPPPRPAASPEPVDRREERRRILLVPLLLAGLVGVLLVSTQLAPGDRGGVLVATATPGPTSAAQSGPTVGPSPSPPPIATPTATAIPTATATATPTPRPTPRPTAPPTQPPATPATPAPVVAPPTAADAVRAFYDAVESHEFDRAAALWTAEMRERYPPDEYIAGRFSPTTRIDVLATRTVDRTDTTARVAVAIREFRSDEDGSRTYEGAWDVVRREGRWLLADPDLIQTG